MVPGFLYISDAGPYTEFKHSAEFLWFNQKRFLSLHLRSYSFLFIWEGLKPEGQVFTGQRSMVISQLLTQLLYFFRRLCWLKSSLEKASILVCVANLNLLIMRKVCFNSYSIETHHVTVCCKTQQNGVQKNLLQEKINFEKYPFSYFSFFPLFRFADVIMNQH